MLELKIGSFLDYPIYYNKVNDAYVVYLEFASMRTRHIVDIHAFIVDFGRRV